MVSLCASKRLPISARNRRFSEGDRSLNPGFLSTKSPNTLDWKVSVFRWIETKDLPSRWVGKL
ncbi:hypothetical protein D3C86_1876910 [compost metagenome]